MVGINIQGAGRLGNHFIRNIIGSMLARKHNLSVQYHPQYMQQILDLGVPLFSGTQTYSWTKDVSNSTAEDLLTTDRLIEFNLNLTDFYQSPKLSWLLCQYLREEDIMQQVIAANPYRSRYQTNNDMIVQVRLGDVTHISPPFSYYDNIIKNIQYAQGYIRTDSWDHPIVRALIAKYHLQPIKTNEVDVIMFGSTCRHIVVWDGSFAYMFCALAFFSQVHYCDKRSFCGEIFDIGMTNWCAHAREH